VKLLLTAVDIGVTDLREDARAGLLVPRHDLTTKKGVDERRLSGVEVTSDEDAGGVVVDAGTEGGDVGEGSGEAAGKELREGLKGEGRKESGEGGGRSGGTVTLPQVEGEDGERVGGSDGSVVLLLHARRFGNHRLRTNGRRTRSFGGRLDNGLLAVHRSGAAEGGLALVGEGGTERGVRRRGGGTKRSRLFGRVDAEGVRVVDGPCGWKER